MANSSAILTDAFPANERGLALGLNQVAAIAGSFIGLVLGGVLGPVEWRLVFLVSVPFGVLGAIWSYLKLQERGIRRPARLDWAGNVTFARRPDRRPRRHHLRHPAVRRPHDGLDQPAGARPDRRRHRGAGDLLRDRDQGRRPDVQPQPVPDPPVHRRQHGQPAVEPRPRRPDVHPDHLAAGHLPADARLRLRPDPAVGRDRDAAADRRLPVRRAAVRAACPTVSARGRSRPAACCWPRLVRPARAAADQLHLLAVRRHPAAQRHRDGPVRLAEPGRHHEQPAARAARRRRRA